MLRGSASHVATAIAFPSGNETTAMKVALVREVLALGVRDLDFTSNTGFLLSGMYDAFAQDLRAVAGAAAAEGAQTKVIIEFGLLPNPALRRRAAELAVEAGVTYLKQSSGFSKGIPATPEDVAFLKQVVGERARVKASGRDRLADEGRGAPRGRGLPARHQLGGGHRHRGLGGGGGVLTRRGGGASFSGRPSAEERGPHEEDRGDGAPSAR